MIKVKIIALGKLKEGYLRSASDEYCKRLSRYCDLEIIELSPIRLPDRPTQSQISAALDSEADLILKRIPENAAVTAMCIEGKPLSSEDFSAVLSQNANRGICTVFIIGSSCGLSERMKQRADRKLSVSSMTFPHQLFRIMLLEQIYRAFKIAEGGDYHK